MRASALLLSLPLLLPARSQDGHGLDELEVIHADEPVHTDIDSLIASFEWRSGTVLFDDGVASLTLAPTHKFLHYDQAYHLLVEVWNNPPGLTEDLLGVVIQSDADVYADKPAYLIYHEWSGYVSDEDADAIDYPGKMEAMITEDSLDNARRRELGYDGLRLIGWALPPFYDRERKALHWAKEMASDRNDRNVLNYNVKVLGRHGILTVNAITTMDHLDEVREELPLILGMLSFNDGYRYDQFDPSSDNASGSSLASLIDGIEPDLSMHRFFFGLKVAAGAFLGALALLIALWVLLVRKKR